LGRELRITVAALLAAVAGPPVARYLERRQREAELQKAIDMARDSLKQMEPLIMEYPSTMSAIQGT
jgi:hypothetical protein